ncbi:MAG: glycosyltransferase [Alphaproteobacteria bacterium]|nr:glycosyltransferase [Alphaproteobacteria bacterium]
MNSVAARNPETTEPVPAQMVDVCVCTFRRPSVTATLESLARQRMQPGWQVRVIVADNDDQPTARDRVERAFEDFGIDGVYLHAPARNISVARNACLDAVNAPLAAFLDDDEIARPDWLPTLVARMADGDADIVFGRVAATYDPAAPRWLAAADLHSTEAVFRNGRIDGGYTCNVLFRSAALAGRRFDPALGRSGGEDTVFFSKMYMDGSKAAYAPEAVVEEPVPEGRSSLRWLMRRAFRSGQTWAGVQTLQGGSRVSLAASGGLKAAYCAAMALMRFYSPAAWRKSAVRGALHLGVAAAALGRAPLQIY